MEINEKAKSVIVLLNNASDLIYVSNDRKNASGVVRAAAIFAKSNGVFIDEWQLENFQSVLYDSRPESLKRILQNIAGEVARKNRK